MEFQNIVRGEPVSLPEMLNAREHRVYFQQELLKKYGCTLISFTLNVAGPVKVFPLAVRTFEEGENLIRSYCKTMGIRLENCLDHRDKTGFEAFFPAACEPEKVKRCMVMLEENSTLGRLFDIDVIRTDGRKVSRQELGYAERKCMICSRPAFECSRSRRHSVSDLQTAAVGIMSDYFADRYAGRIAQTACRALLYEVHATPKPGLVDSDNNGSHADMDVFTFESSALSILPYFKAFTACGINNAEKPGREVMELIRPIGVEAEIEMRRATNNVNTHKGAIFSFGIFCAALGILYGRSMPYSREKLSALCAGIAGDVPEELNRENASEKEEGTAGEICWKKYHIGGIREEAAKGYPAVFNLALPAFCARAARGFPLNDAGILTLVDLMAVTEDTNIIHRSSEKELRKIQEQMKQLSADHLEEKNYRRVLKELDRKFAEQKISPGGSADLLAITYFLYFIEEGISPNKI